MANLAAKMVKAFFETKDLKSEVIGDNEEVLRIGFRLDNKESETILCIFSEDGTDVKIRAPKVAKYPEAKRDEIYKICNELNRQYRWVKFVANDDDNVIYIDEDAIIQMDTCGDEVLHGVISLIRIEDDALPSIMKTIWG